MLVQVSVLDVYPPFGGTADLVLVALIAIALLRGSIFGAIAGFGAGYLIDTANLGILGFTSLLLTLAGFWTGRYGETTARDRFHAPYTSVAVITLLYGDRHARARLRARTARARRPRTSPGCRRRSS